MSGERLPLLLPDLVPELGSWHVQARALSARGLEPSTLLAPASRSEQARAATNLRLAVLAPPSCDFDAGRLDAGMRAQDEFFEVRRVVPPAASAAEVFLAGVLSAHLEALHDARQTPTRLPARDWPALLAGVAAIYGLGEPPAAAGDWTPATAPRRTPDPAAALRRWRRGHRLFFVLIQAIVSALLRFTRAVAEGDDDAGRTALADAGALQRSAAAALRFTAGFGAGVYEEVIRPGMRPPHVLPGFSGAHHGDHQALIGLFRGLGPLFASIDPGVYPVKAFRVAAGDMFAAHLGVCSRFGGKRKPSLLMEAQGHTDPAVTAVIVLRQLVASRAALFAEP